MVRSSKENAYVLCLCKEGVGDDGGRLRETLQERFRWLWDVDVVGQAEGARKVMMAFFDEEDEFREGKQDEGKREARPVL